MTSTALAIIQVAVTTGAASVIGGTLRGHRVVFEPRSLRWSTDAAIGFLVISYSVFLLALAGHASRTSLTLLSGALAAIAVASLASTVLRARSRGAPADHEAVQPDRARWPAALVAIAYAGWIILCALLPPAEPDELIHHLAVPRKILETGALVPFVDNIYAYFPAAGEMLFLLGLGVGGELAARLFHSVFGVLGALALYGYSQRQLSRSAAWGALALFFCVPSVIIILPWAYVDLMFTLYTLLSLVFLLQFFETRRVRCVVLSGVMAGGALATKYTGVQLILLLVLCALVEHLISRRRNLPIAPFALAGIALAIATPYLLRNWLLTGWPLFPFPLGSYQLRPGINWDADRAALFLTMLASYGSGTDPIGPASVWDSLAAPLLVFLNAQFNNPRWYDGVVGPVFLLIPWLLWRRTQAMQVRMLVIFAVLFLVYWAFTVRQVRFLIPALPVLSFLLAAGLEQRASLLVRGVVTAAMASNVWIAGVKAVNEDAVAFWTGAISRDAYLAERVPEYPMYQAANQRLRPTDRLYLINMRNYGYYLHPDWRADFVFELYRLNHVLDATTDPRDVAAFFTSQGVNHVLIDERITYSDPALVPEQREILQQFFAQRATLLERADGRALYRIHEQRVTNNE